MKKKLNQATKQLNKLNIKNFQSDWKKGRDDQSGHKLADFLWYAETAIVPIRNAGWRGTLIVDSTAYAQSPNAILKYGSELINRDPKKNIMFSLHLYADWRESSKYDQSMTLVDFIFHVKRFV